MLSLPVSQSHVEMFSSCSHWGLHFGKEENFLKELVQSSVGLKYRLAPSINTGIVNLPG